VATLWLYSSAPVVYKNLLVFPSTFSELEGEQYFALHTSSNEQQEETRKKKMNEPKRRGQFITISINKRIS